MGSPKESKTTTVLGLKPAERHEAYRYGIELPIFERPRAMTKPTEAMHVCPKCIMSNRFQKWIRRTGERGQCDIVENHGNRCRVVTIRDLAEYVDEIIRDEYQLGGEDSFYDGDSDRVYYEQRGSSLLDIISDQLLCDEDLAEKIIESLPDVSDRDIAQGDEPFYDSTANYEKIADVEASNRAARDEYWYINRFSFQWEDFCECVKYKRRFFRAKELLDDLFGKPSEYEGGGPVNPVYLLKSPLSVYRARVLDASFTEDSLNADPAKEVGAPPRDKATAGRMNVEFIPAFYAAFSEQTAVAETRPDIGEEVAIGEFILQKDVKVFDFTVFTLSEAEDKRHSYAHTRYDFIEQMEGEMSRQVRSHEKRRDYIPTQIVSEYLTVYFGCDAIIYHSAVVSGRSKEHRNVVFLPRADPFVGGGNAILKFSRFQILRVEDVNYTLSDIRF